VNTLYTVGHSTRTLAELIGLLRAHGVQIVADVRRWPVSARCPHFARDTLAAALAAAGIRYEHLGRGLGGYRPGGYEAYTTTRAFAEGLAELERLAAQAPLAVL
jgi:uncharacterized protein (DUF488 family)